MWSEIYRTSLDCSSQQFCDALQVWINKPHTVNRRLVGIRESDFTEKEVENNRAHLLQEEAISEGDDIESCFLRELIPRQITRYHTTVEKVLQVNRDSEISFLFLPLVHTDENGSVLHADNSLALWVSYDTKAQVFSARTSSHNDESHCPTLGASDDWIHDVLLKRLVSWCQQTSLDTETKSLRLIPVDSYARKYQELKDKYGQYLVQNWPEKTDPRKFVYEDIAIASYLAVLWEQEEHTARVGNCYKKPSFVDLGCGNGLLVYILSKEGYHSVGYDIRKRGVWDLFGSDAALSERTITPSDECLFPEFDWLIGNHSDELTLWIPVMAARSSATCKFVVLPCCPWDFTCRFAEKRRGLSLYQSYLGFVEKVIDACGFKVERDVMRIPSTKRVCFIGRIRMDYTSEELNKRIQDLIQSRTPTNTSLCNAPTTKDKQNSLQATYIFKSSKNDNTKVNCDCVTAVEDKERDQTCKCSKLCSASNSKTVTNLSTTVICEQCNSEVTVSMTSQALCDEKSCIVTSQLNIDGQAIAALPELEICKLCGFKKNDVSALVNKMSLTNEDESSNWAADFKARKFEDEKTSHCTGIENWLKHDIVSTVYNALLSTSDIGLDDFLIVATNGKSCKRGGKLRLNEIAGMFDSETMLKLKNECGGLQTLLKNHHQVFEVRAGSVRIRDWSAKGAMEFEAMQEARAVRRGQSVQQVREMRTNRWKSQLCYHHDNHPNGCPLPAHDCRFAHGTDELRTPANIT